MLCSELYPTKLDEKVLPDGQLLVRKMFRSIRASRQNSQVLKAKLEDAGVPVEAIKSAASSVTVATGATFAREVTQIYRSFRVKDLPKSVGYFLVLYVVEEVARAILTNVTNDHIADVIMGAIVGPVAEEYAKRLALKRGFGETYVNVFATSEMGLYLLTGGSGLIQRLISLLFHYVFFTIQKYNMKPNWKLDLIQDDSDPAKKAGFVTAAILHSLWNTILLAG